ncbi:MAG: class I SAM-dependent methyltransferase [Verrucomicrobia bacterium]|nr:class I SAM-dependent methyltransferase [Verrucomicrobiota bacterium]
MNAARLWAGLKRRLALVPALDRWFARRDDERRFQEAIGHLSRGKSLLMHLEAARKPEDFLALSKKLLGPHQDDDEICRFLEFAAAHGLCTRVLEIGVAAGGTNFLLAHALPDVRLVLGVDLRLMNERILRFFRQTPQRFEYVEGSSQDPAALERVRRALDGQPLDLLFIDGDHHYAGVAADFTLYRPLVRPGGLIAFHDIVPDHQTRHGRATGRWAGDVPILWAELKPHFRTHEFVHDPGQDGLGIGVLEHDPSVPWPPSDRP